VERPRIRYVESPDDVSVAYWTVGSGPPLVILNALSFSHVQAELELGAAVEFVGALSDVASVSRLDLRNQGLSTRGLERVSLEGLVADVAAVAETFDEPVVLVGMGDTVAIVLSVAERHPDLVRGLALFSPVLQGAFREPSDVLSAIMRLSATDWETASELLAVLLVGLEEAAHAQDLAAVLKVSTTFEESAALRRAIRLTDLERVLQGIEVPTLVISQESPFVDEKAVAACSRLIRGAELVTLGRGGVGGWTPQFAVELRRFLVELDPEVTAEPDRGLQTVLFTDIEASTPLTQRLGDEGAQELVHEHDAAVRAALREQGGREVKHTGDGIMASFASAVSAVRAGLQIQQLLSGNDVRVRVGLNAGEPIAEDGDLFGTVGQLAARITDRAEAGQVLVSNVVRELCAGKEFVFEPLGEVELKGFGDPVVLFEAGRPG